MKTKKRSFTKKRILILIGSILLVVGGRMAYTILFVSDIPITQPNVNHKKVGNLEITKDTLHDYLNNELSIIDTGKFVVKEDREAQKSNHIEIYFERMKTTAKNPLPPIIFLAGGPGSSSTRVGRTKYFYLFKELSKYADVILLDQRGVGKSIPNLSCRNFLDIPVNITENIQEQIINDVLDKCRECADEFKAQKIKLSAYNSYESVLDIEALRKVLGYDRVTLYGYSYGTELAQIYIKHFEKNVESAIFAGPLAPDHGLKLPFEVQSQYEKMDSLVRLDKKLSKYIPDFMSMVQQTHEKLKGAPVSIKIPIKDAFGNNPSGAEETLANVIAVFRPTIDMILTDDHLQMMVSDKIGQDRTIKRLPKFYYKMSKENYRETGNNLRNFKRRRMPNALFFTANAASRYTEDRWQKSIEQGKTAIFSHFGISYSRFPEVYNTFNENKIDGMNNAVAANTKLLLIGGSLDGRTPSNLTDDIATRFPDNYRVKVENTGHSGLLNNEIMNSIILFLKDSLDRTITISNKLEFEPPVPYKYSMVDTLQLTIEKKNVKEGIHLYQKLYKDYYIIDDYIFDFGSQTFDKLYDNLIEEKAYTNAIELLEFAIKKFPESFILHRNLGEVYSLIQDKKKAIIHLEEALNLNFFDGKSQALIRKLKRTN